MLNPLPVALSKCGICFCIFDDVVGDSLQLQCCTRRSRTPGAYARGSPHRMTPWREPYEKTSTQTNCRPSVFIQLMKKIVRERHRSYVTLVLQLFFSEACVVVDAWPTYRELEPFGIRFRLGFVDRAYKAIRSIFFYLLNSSSFRRWFRKLTH